MARKSRMQNAREAKDRRMKFVAGGGAVLLVAVLAFEVPHMLQARRQRKQRPGYDHGDHRGERRRNEPDRAARDDPVRDGRRCRRADEQHQAAGLGHGAEALQVAALLVQSLRRQGPVRAAGFLRNLPVDAAHFDGYAGPVADGHHRGKRAERAPAATSVRTLAKTGTATISVNGKLDTVRIGGSFPSSNPLFKLVSITHGAARIGIANGSYQSGAQTVTLVEWSHADARGYGRRRPLQASTRDRFLI